MNDGPEYVRQLKAVDDRINNVRADIEVTERKIDILTQVNARRKRYLRELGQKRAELLNFEFVLE